MQGCPRIRVYGRSLSMLSALPASVLLRHVPPFRRVRVHREIHHRLHLRPWSPPKRWTGQNG